MMHCVSSYPLNAENVNFNKMRELTKIYNKIGYSGHYSGIDDAKIAICLGATYVEKHFTIDKSLQVEIINLQLTIKSYWN